MGKKVWYGYERNCMDSIVWQLIYVVKAYETSEKRSFCYNYVYLYISVCDDFVVEYNFKVYYETGNANDGFSAKNM